MNPAQLRTMLWLRLRLTRSQWRRAGPVNAVVMLVVTVACLATAVLGAIGGVFLGALALSHESAVANMATWDVLVLLFLSFWTVGIIFDLQRSEMIDLGRLMHLPVSLRDVFLLNYVASHLSFSIVLFLPAMLGLAVGMVLGRGLVMVLLIPLVLGFVFMVTAWTYCLRGWLAALMVNKRRRRAIIVGVTLTFILLTQLPNLVMNLRFRGGPPDPLSNASTRSAREAEFAYLFEMANCYLPPLWLPLGSRSLAEGHLLPALLAATGLYAIGALGLLRAYRGTLRFYQGGKTRRKPPAPASPPPARNAGKKLLVEWKLPWVPDEAAAVALAGFRSMVRAPEIKMALAVNVIMFAVIGASAIFGPAANLPALGRPFFAAGAVVMVMMGVTQVLANQFGFDRSGFRTFVLSPAQRRHILLGKNLALSLLALPVFAVCLALMTLLAHLHAADVLTAVVEFFAAVAVLSVLGNLTSILNPYRVAVGSLKPTKMKGVTVLLNFVTHFMLLAAMAPVFLPALLGLAASRVSPLPASAVTLAAALVLTALSAAIYYATLEPLGRLLQQRQRRILDVVTQEIE